VVSSAAIKSSDARLAGCAASIAARTFDMFAIEQRNKPLIDLASGRFVDKVKYRIFAAKRKVDVGPNRFITTH
jgi:hypothetical protein